jgi:thiol-disulfide isomerase/thioredoxin
MNIYYSTLVKVMGAAVSTNNEEDDDEIGFTTSIGQFDSLIDTIANERKGSVDSGSSVLQLLHSKHNCAKYISTLSKSQQIVKKDGVIFGPGKANAHIKSLESIDTQKCTPLVPSGDFGQTLQVLLGNKIIYPSKSSKPTVTRGWSLKEYWEETSWPRDSNGSGVRYGMPTVEEEDLDELFRRERIMLSRRMAAVDQDEEEEEGRAVAVKVEENPYVKQITGTRGLSEEVIMQRKNAVVFVAMRSCRTCKGINPVYTRIAREYNGDVMFAKADATGKVGKELGRQLGVVSVPSFVLFRNGVRYGSVAASKLPSDRLDKAISLLEAGEDFDPSLEEEDDE